MQLHCSSATIKYLLFCVLINFISCCVACRGKQVYSFEFTVPVGALERLRSIRVLLSTTYFLKIIIRNTVLLTVFLQEPLNPTHLHWQCLSISQRFNRRSEM